jgi:hypothetical protein
MSRVFAFVLGTIALVAAFGAPDGVAQRDEVTLRLEREYDAGNRTYRLRFSGTIPSGAANEYVAVLQQKCGSGSGGGTAIAGASTRAGGAWEAPPISGAGPGQDSSIYRARWRGRLSQPLEFRASLPMSITRLGGGRYQASVRTWGTFQVMGGRIVELQRHEDGQWIQVQRARLTGSGTYFTTTFSVRTPGLSLRVLVPAQSAGPCYVATASETWVSEEPGSAGSGAHVIDRSVLCSISPRGGLRQISIQANSGLPQATRVPSFTVLSGHGRLAQGSTGYMELHAALCTRTKASVRLATGKLRSRPPGSLGREFTCGTPPRVLIRVRAVFGAPTALRRGRPYGWPALTAEGAVSQNSLAIRTQAGKPLAFASLSESGPVRFFVARSCAED